MRVGLSVQIDSLQLRFQVYDRYGSHKDSTNKNKANHYVLYGKVKLSFIEVASNVETFPH